MDFKKAQQYSSNFGETNDCSVKALAINCNVPYAVAHKALYDAGREHYKGVSVAKIIKAYEMLGFELQRIRPSCSKLGGIKRDATFSNGQYAVVVRRHILAVRNNQIEDWSNGRQFHIISAYKVMPTVSRKERKELKAKLMAA